MGFGSQPSPSTLPCLLALSCLQERAEKNPQIISVQAVACMGMKLSKENTINPTAAPGGEDPQGHFPHPMAMVEKAKSCTQVSGSAPQKFT